jgi:hypothetical protein
MLCVTVLGLGLFLRYSLGKFLRVWLLRQIYEGQSHVEQVLEATRTDATRTEASPPSDDRSDAVL